MITFYPFTTSEIPELTQVGGKGLSLILMTRAGLPVPPGFILPVSFFDPWTSALRDTSEWAAMQKGNPGNIKQVTEDLKELCRHLTLNQGQQQVLENAIQQLQKTARTTLFAVRASSLDEDLEGASFAGGYKTILGVPATGIEEAIWSFLEISCWFESWRQNFLQRPNT